MPIPITHQPEGYDPPYEACCFCCKPTPYWHVPKDVPVCTACAPIHAPKEVPSKDEWFEREMKKHRNWR